MLPQLPFIYLDDIFFHSIFHLLIVHSSPQATRKHQHDVMTIIQLSFQKILLSFSCRKLLLFLILLLL